MNPKLTFSLGSAAFFVFAATGFVTTTGPAIAQQSVETMDEIVVEAPIARRTVGRGMTGAKIEDIELRRRVSYADLDLSNQTDVIELQKRIEQTARKSCQQLSDMFPLDPFDTREINRCTAKAIDGTESQVQMAINASS